MPALLTTDKRWYHLDGYERRGASLVKTITKGPFQARPADAQGIVVQTAGESPSAKLVLYVWNPGAMRWQRTS